MKITLSQQLPLDEITSNFPQLTVTCLERASNSHLYEFTGPSSTVTRGFNAFYAMARRHQKHLEFAEKLNKLPVDLKGHVEATLDIIKKAINEYSMDNLAFSFNGGKDCTVLLYLIDYASYSCKLYKDRMKTLYILPETTFASVEDFCERISSSLQLNLCRHPYPMKTGLQQFLSNHPSVQGIFLGVRRTDPYAADMKDFQETTAGWPVFMRINPILEWKYSHVWTFLRTMELEYCDLYDMGYTSIGSTDNTIPNPLLASDNGFKPAYMLEDESAERNGRLK